MNAVKWGNAETGTQVNKYTGTQANKFTGLLVYINLSCTIRDSLSGAKGL